MPNSHCGKSDHVECFSADALLKDVFLDSDTAMAVLSHVPGGLETNPLDFEAAGSTRRAANALDGSERLLLHGRCMPTLAGEIDGMAVSGVGMTGKRVPHQDRAREIIGVWSTLVPREDVPPVITWYES